MIPGHVLVDAAQRARFLGAFLREPFATGSLTPSSQALARRMVEAIGLETACTVVEAGPGTGAFTAAILETCPAAADVVAVEVNAAFVGHLRRRHPRVEVVHGSVEHLPRQLAALRRPAADVVVSGLPWAVLDAASQQRLLAGIAAGLRPGGHFATFGYAHCALLPAQRRFQRLLAREFEFVGRSPIVWSNLWPAVVYRWRKRPGA